jgi:hypothetical protein
MNLPRGGFLGLLDLFPNAAAAYSLRKLRAAYSGSAVRVRRSSDNTEQDIGFTTQGELDTTSLLSFVNEEVVQYTSDFSSGSDSIGQTFLTLNSNQTIDGVSECLQGVLNGGSQLHRFTITEVEDGFDYDVSLDYYIPNGQTTAKMLVANATVTSGSSELSTTGSWTTASFSINATSTAFQLRFADASDSLFIDADGEFVAIKNIVITQTTADGLVSTWYDQSLSNNATQTTAANQPKIVSAGSLVTENGKAAIDFDGTDDYFGFTSLALDNMLISSVQKIDTNASALYNGSSDYFRSRLTGYRTSINSATIDFLGATIQQQTLLSFQRVGSALELFEDGASLGSVSNSSTFNIDEIGGNDVSFLFQGNLQELIIYTSNQSANRTGIETNINNFYSIYP